MTVKHLLEQKGGNLWTIDQDATVLDALAKMAEKDIGSLVVMVTPSSHHSIMRWLLESAGEFSRPAFGLPPSRCRTPSGGVQANKDQRLALFSPA
jgi:hypothetical protein